jgi:hypothetical protein
MAADPRDVFHASLIGQTTGSSDFDLNPEVVLPPDRVSDGVAGAVSRAD